MCVLSVKYRKMSTKLSEWSGKLIQIPCVFLSLHFFKLLLPSERYVDTHISIWLLILTMIMGFIISVCSFKKECAKTAYSFVSVLAFFIVIYLFVFSYLFFTLGLNTAYDEAYSPDNTYVAYIIEGNYGATGGEQLVYVRENIDIVSF